MRDVPIYSESQYKDSVHYVPLLAKEGVKHKVGGDDARGGLLGEINVLELLACGHIDADQLYLDVMKETQGIETPFEGRYSGPRPFVLCMQP